MVPTIPESVSETTFISPYAESKNIIYNGENTILTQNHSSEFFPGTCQVRTITASECYPSTPYPKLPYNGSFLSATKESTGRLTSDIQRHRPGRLRKTTKGTSTSAVKSRRKSLNESASRSRARLNKALDGLWKVLPEQDQDFYLKNRVDNNKDPCRADKVEVAVAHIKNLQAQIRTASIFSQLSM
jgi:hypothetical protein